MNHKFFYLLLLSFVFVASCAVALSGKSRGLLTNVTDARPTTFSPIPILTNDNLYPVLSAQSALVIDVDSGISLYEKEPDKELLPASTTKIITALVAMDHFPDDLVVEIKLSKVEGQKMGLKNGEKIKIGDLLYGLLVYSANDAAEALAAAYPGGRDVFIQTMNDKAKELHLNNSSFKNPTGLDGGGHYTTARDLIRVSKVAMRIPRFAEIVGTKEKIITSVNGVIHKIFNINELLGKVQGVLGVKTGWTENARENLVTYVERDGKKVMIVLLGSQDRFGETTELINWIYDNYSWQEVKYPPL
jgi:D-alanyl-D-alanine carboxypeptidase (penicillin-binding protein 5/6)